MSVAAEYAAKLKRHVETAGEPGPTYRFTISYRDLTELVVAALELEQLKGQRGNARPRLPPTSAPSGGTKVLAP